MKISVVIPTFRRPTLLGKCLQALATQDFSPDEFEIIVVSDGPDAQTREAVINWHRRNHLRSISFFELDTKKGPAAARNLGWRMAKSKLVAFTDDDCIPSAEWLKAIWTGYTSIYGQPDLVAFTGRVDVPETHLPTDYEKNTSNLADADFITANCACTRNALQLIEGFDERFQLAWREDSDLEFRLLENEIPIYKLEDALVTHPVRKATWGVSIREQKKTMFNALLFKNNPRLFREKIQRSPEWSYYLIIISTILFAIAAMNDLEWLGWLSGCVYLLLTIRFIYKRLSNTSKAPDHVVEMILTSLVIPFLSIYWTIYGSFKYRVLYF